MRLKELREEKGLFQRELANIFHISKNSVYNWENGISEPNIDLLIKLANYFECSIDYLLGRESESGLIEIKGTQLRPDEVELLALYQKLNYQDKNQLIGFAKALAY